MERKVVAGEGPDPDCMIDSDVPMVGSDGPRAKSTCLPAQKRVTFAEGMKHAASPYRQYRYPDVLKSRWIRARMIDAESEEARDDGFA